MAIIVQCPPSRPQIALLAQLRHLHVALLHNVDASLAPPSTTRPLRGVVDDVHGEDSVVDERACELVHVVIVSCSEGDTAIVWRAGR